MGIQRQGWMMKHLMSGAHAHRGWGMGIWGKWWRVSHWKAESKEPSRVCCFYCMPRKGKHEQTFKVKYFFYWSRILFCCSCQICLAALLFYTQARTFCEIFLTLSWKFSADHLCILVVTDPFSPLMPFLPSDGTHKCKRHICGQVSSLTPLWSTFLYEAHLNYLPITQFSWSLAVCVRVCVSGTYLGTWATSSPTFLFN